MEWKGVMPAMTTAFDDNLNVDHDFMAKHALWLIENGCSGLVCRRHRGRWRRWRGFLVERKQR